MTQSFFVTGTDTEIGKTQVSCALIRQLVNNGLRVIGMKPIASGALITSEGLRNDDALQLLSASNVDAPYELVNPYCFEPAIAPHIAAQQAGVVMSRETILEAYQELSALADVVVVEGVGGWLVPINDQHTVADIAAILHLPVVLVVGMRLGCLNHALLTAQSIQSKQIRLAGWVANIMDAQMPCLTENLTTLNRFMPAPQLGVMPFLHDENAQQDINFKTGYIK